MGSLFVKSSLEDKNLETFSLIWLDSEVNKSSHNLSAQRELRQFINQLKTYEDTDKCQNDIQSLTETDRIIFLCSGSCGEKIVPNIHSLRQVYSIYIFCWDKAKHEKWSTNYVKVRGVFSRKNDFIRKILTDIANEKFNRFDEQLSISVYEGEDFADDIISQSTQHFIYSQILIDNLLRLPISEKEKGELYSLCQDEYKSNESELVRINYFKNRYSSADAISLYTDGNFLYKMLIKALRNQNIHVLFLLRYIISDIQQQIEKNHLSSSLICVYRGQLMFRTEFRKLEQYRGKFISINAFLTAMSDPYTAKHFLSSAIVTDDVEKVLFEIHADGTVENIQPFMNIYSDSSGQEQTLFSIGSIFRLDDIGLGENNMKFIRITLCPKNHDELQPIFTYIKNIYESADNSPLTFGEILRKFNKYDEAEKYYYQLLKILPSQDPNRDECDKALYAIVAERQSFLSLYDSFVAFENKLKKKNVLSAYEYCERANEFRQKREFERAIDYYNKALAIFQDKQQEIGRCYQNLARVYQEAKQYEQALSYYEKSRDILQNHLHADHRDLIEIDNNIESLRQTMTS